jgi:dipeptidyl-peptidase-4
LANGKTTIRFPRNAPERADVGSGKVQKVRTERDGVWVDVNDDAAHWVNEGNAFTWVSERDGWRHLYLDSRDGTTLIRVTNGEFDVIRVLHLDEKAGWAYYIASLDNPTQPKRVVRISI